MTVKEVNINSKVLYINNNNIIIIVKVGGTLALIIATFITYITVSLLRTL